MKRPYGSALPCTKLDKRSILSMRNWLCYYFPTCKEEIMAGSIDLLRETIDAVIE